jgi:hypothetical protein
MVQKKDVNAMGIVFGLVFGIVNLVYLLIILILPEDSIRYIFGSFMYGVDFTQIAITPTLSWITLLGFVITILGGYLIGILFAIFYNKFAKGK